MKIKQLLLELTPIGATLTNVSATDEAGQLRGDVTTGNFADIAAFIADCQTKAESVFIVHAELWEGHHYTVTDEAITPAGTVELWKARTRDEAVKMALYTHRLHNGNAFSTPRGVIHCPTCGQVAIVKAK